MLLRAVHTPGFDLGLEQDVAGVEIGKAHAPGMLVLGQDDPTAMVEVELDAVRATLRGHSGRRRISALLGHEARPGEQLFDLRAP